MIRAADLTRFVDTTMVIANGDVREQMDTWGIDHDEFMEWMTAYANAFGLRCGVDPRVVLVAVFSGFELGYRSCAEQPIEHAPDALPEDA